MFLVEVILAANNTVSYLVVAGGGGGGLTQEVEVEQVVIENQRPSRFYTASPLMVQLQVEQQFTSIQLSFSYNSWCWRCYSTRYRYQMVHKSKEIQVDSSFSTITSSAGGGGGGAGVSPMVTSCMVVQVVDGMNNNVATGGSGNTPPVSPPQGNNGGAWWSWSSTGTGAGGGGGADCSRWKWNFTCNKWKVEGGAGATINYRISSNKRWWRWWWILLQAWWTGGGGGGGAGSTSSANCRISNWRSGTANTGGGGGGSNNNINILIGDWRSMEEWNSNNKVWQISIIIKYNYDKYKFQSQIISSNDGNQRIRNYNNIRWMWKYCCFSIRCISNRFW